jgi:hypothetical protein
MSFRTIDNFRLVDGEKIDNLPNDTQNELDNKVEQTYVDSELAKKQNTLIP